jgi:hypothetical protein
MNISVTIAIPDSNAKSSVSLTQWTKLHLYDPSGGWSSCILQAVITPSLCVLVLLGLLFLSNNNIVIDHAARTAIDKTTGFDLLNPKVLPITNKFLFMVKHNILAELKIVQPHFTSSAMACMVEGGQSAAEIANDLCDLQKKIIHDNKDVFAQIPHIDDLPTDVYCCIKLKDEMKTVMTKTYSTPREYKDAWDTLIQQHLNAGRIRPSSSVHASPTFLVSKSDPTALPRWVNNY